MKRLKNKKGFTLVEVIVAMGITTIIMVAAANLFTPAMQMINDTRNDENLDVVCDTVNTYVRNKIDTAANANVVALSAISDAVTDYAGQTDAAKYTIKAVAVIDGKLYDFGAVTPTTINNGMLNAPAISGYRVFNDDFYNDTGLRIRFEGKLDSAGGKNYAKWLKIGTQCTTAGGGANQEKIITFKMLGGKVELPASVTSDISFDSSTAFAIVYREANIPTTT